MPKDVIVACDFPNCETTFRFLDKFSNELNKPFLKIGMELFYGEGPAIVREIKNRGHKIFLDLKLHDIPNTVKSAMKVLAELDVDITNVHASGSINMMKAALEGLTRDDGTRPLLIAVTQLTSTDQETMKNDLLINAKLEDVVSHYAQNAAKSGLDGVVCSPLEANKVHNICGQDFLTICPGVRFENINAKAPGTSFSNIGDQKRVMSPAAAAEAGCDYIVMGRPITQADDPVKSYNIARKDFLGE